MELFLVDGEWKWSGLGGWDAMKGPLVNVSMIAERFTQEVTRIEDKLDFDRLPQMELRDRWARGGGAGTENGVGGGGGGGWPTGGEKG